jgi:hypothetical protein
MAPRQAPSKIPRSAAHKVGVTYEDVRRMGQAFPGIEEGTSYGTPALKVRGAFLLRLREDGETLALKTTFVDRDLLLQADPDAYFLTDHYVNYPVVLVRLSQVRAADLRDRLEESWRRLASKRHLEDFAQQESGQAPLSRPAPAARKKRSS